MAFKWFLCLHGLLKITIALCAFIIQVVVLARIIPDAEQALSTAAGIKILIDLVQDSTDNAILALSCDCIARHSHTRAGILKQSRTRVLKS